MKNSGRRKEKVKRIGSRIVRAFAWGFLLSLIILPITVIPLLLVPGAVEGDVIWVIEGYLTERDIIWVIGGYLTSVSIAYLLLTFERVKPIRAILYSGLALAIGVFIMAFAVNMSTTPSVYFDNGYENEFDIFVDGIKEGSVNPVSREKILIEGGEHVIEIRKKDGELFESNKVSLTEFRYIYNIGRKYEYYIETRMYGSKSGRGAKDVGSETFFPYPEVFYDLNEEFPDSIIVSGGATYAERTKLKRRINPKATEQTGTTDITQLDEEGWYSGSSGITFYVGQTSIIEFDSPKTVEQAYVKVGCNDGEKMDGYIEYWDGQKWVDLTSFSDAGCGDYVNFDQVITDKLSLTMTGGGGNDEYISSDGWKVHVADDEGNEKESYG